MDLPKNMEMDKLTGVVDILSNKVTGATSSEIRAINNNLTEKVIEATVFVGLVKAQNNKFILSEYGKKFFQAQDSRGKNETLRELLKNIVIYNLAIEYFYHNKLEKPTKLDVGSFWAQNYESEIKGLSEEDITSSIIFFLKFLELASLGKFINAGRGRETSIQLDLVEIAKYITSSSLQPEMKIPPKSEKKPPSSEISKPQSEEDGAQGSSNILKRLNPELVWSDLDSEGARKLIIDKLNVLTNENIVLDAKVEEYQKLLGVNAVLLEKVHNLKTDNLFRASVNSIGGIVLGAALTISDPVYRYVGSILGAILVLISVFLKQSESKKPDDQ